MDRIEDHPRAANNVSLRSTFSFVLVGGFATAVQYVLMALLIWAFAMPMVIASGIGFIVSAGVNYLLNARITFRSEASYTQTLPKFLATSAMGLIINSLSLSLLSAYGVVTLLAQIVTTLFVLIWNYTINALWTFKNLS